jgi:hypothetical protein
MVTLEGAQRFYARRTNGKYQLDVQQLREAFVGAEREADRIRDFRLQRLSAIGAGETPVQCDASAPKVVLHLLPLASGRHGSVIDLPSVESPTADIPTPLGGRAGSQRHNFDGVVAWRDRAPLPSPTYVQLFRTGAIEAMSTEWFENPDPEQNVPYVVYIRQIESEIVRGTSAYLAWQQRHGVELPIYAMISLLRVRDHWCADILDRQWRFEAGHPIERNDLLVAEVLIETFDARPEVVLRSAFNTIWQATGIPASRCYGADGSWTQPK